MRRWRGVKRILFLGEGDLRMREREREGEGELEKGGADPLFFLFILSKSSFLKEDVV